MVVVGWRGQAMRRRGDVGGRVTGGVAAGTRSEASEIGATEDSAAKTLSVRVICVISRRG